MSGNQILVCSVCFICQPFQSLVMSTVIRTIWTQQSEDQASDSNENGNDGEVSFCSLPRRMDFYSLFLETGGMMPWRC